MEADHKQRAKGVEEARQHLPAVLADAVAGHTTIITRHGRAVAAVVPVGSVKPASPVSLQSLAGTGRGLWGANSGRTIAELRDEWNR